MHYAPSGTKAQEEQKSEKDRGVAITLWAILCAILVAYIFPIPEELFGEFGDAMMLKVLPATMAIIIIYSAVLYCRAHKNKKEKDKLRTGSKVLLIMSLVMLVFIVVLWAKGVIEVNSYLTKYNLRGTSGADGAWMALLALAPISVTSIIGFLSFLIASIKLKKWSKKY